MPIVWIQRHRSITRAPSSRSRPSSPRRRARRVSATSAEARTRASLTNQAMLAVCQMYGWSRWASRVGWCWGTFAGWLIRCVRSDGSAMSSPDAFELLDVDAGPVDGDPILRGIDLVVPANGATVLAGPSGAGKSTLLRLLNRLDDPVGGEVRWRGRTLTDWSPTELRRQVAMVFQRPPIFPGTVFENLQVASADVGVDRAAHVLEHVGLSAELLDHEADTLSGGEAQRMCVARALLTEPAVLLADEPTAALDRAARVTVEDLGRMLADSGMAVIWVSHDTDQLRRLADHVIVLADGAVRAVGHLAELDASTDPIVRQSVGAP